MSGALSLVRHPLVVRLAQVVIGVVFIAAALPKVGDLSSFAQSIHNFRLVPVALENMLAMALPWIELVAGLALVSNIRSRAGAWIAAVLMVIFTVAVGAALARGLDFECGCFGTADASSVGAGKLFENVVLSIVAAVGVLRPGKRGGAD